MARVRWLRFVALTALVGCPTDPTTRCGELVCPADWGCDPRGPGCVPEERLVACAGRADGDACVAPSVPAGLCQGGVCVAVGCGNGLPEADLGEVCDDGNRVSLDGCSGDCRSAERCGDGVVDPGLGEDCDCGDPSAPSPTPTCAGGNRDAPGAWCRTDCGRAGCGDGVVDPGEWCDDGNTQPGDGCRADCAGRFTAMPSPTLRTLRAVWGTSPTDVWAVGDQIVLHYDGAAWTPVAVPGSAGDQFHSVGGSARNDVWLASTRSLQHHDGVAWTTRTLASGASFTSLWAGGGRAVVTITDSFFGDCTSASSGRIEAWIAGTWRTQLTRTQPPAPCRLAATGPTELLALSSSVVAGWTSDGNSWTAITLPRPVEGALAGVAPGQFHASLRDSTSNAVGLYRGAGTTWAPSPGGDFGLDMQVLAGIDGDVIGMTLTSAGNPVIVGYDGARWSPIPTSGLPQMHGAWVSAPGRAFLVGDGGAIAY